MRTNRARSGLLAIERTRVDRKNSGRQEKGSALIVCEGEFTEPYYLKGFLAHLYINISSVDVIAGHTRSNAVAVVIRDLLPFPLSPNDRLFVVIVA